MGIKRTVRINYRTYPSADATEYSRKRAVEEAKGAVTLLEVIGIPLGCVGLLYIYSMLSALPSMQDPSLSEILRLYFPFNWVPSIIVLSICGSYYYYLFSLRRAITHMRCMLMCYGNTVKKAYTQNAWLTVAEYVAYNTLLIPTALSIGGIILSIQHTEFLIPLLPISLAILVLAVFVFVFAFLFFKKRKL